MISHHRLHIICSTKVIGVCLRYVDDDDDDVDDDDETMLHKDKI